MVRIVVLIACVITGLAAPVAARDCPTQPFGLIGERWRALDGADGPLGCPVGNEFGVEGQKDLPGDTTGTSPALAGHAGRLFLAWKGSGNDAINLMLSNDAGVSFGFKRTFGETTDRPPALVSDGAGLVLAWKGSGDEHINIARVGLFANTAGVMGIEGLTNKVTLPETTDHAPALAFHQGRIFLAWRGSGNEQLNIAVSLDGGRTFRVKRVLAETSEAAPALASTSNGLVLAWKGAGNDAINVARVVVTGNTTGGVGIEGLADKATLGDESDNAPALAFTKADSFLAGRARATSR